MNHLRSRLYGFVMIGSGGLMAAAGPPSRLVLLGLLAIALGGLGFLLGYRFARRRHTALRRLVHIAQKMPSNQVSSDELHQLTAIASRNPEVGQLATVLHDIALVIAEREQHMSAEIAHLQAQVRPDVQQSTGLEMAYYEALRKKSVWLRQQLVAERETVLNSKFKIQNSKFET